MAKKHQPREDQQYMPGMEPKKNNKVDAAARRYVRLRDARIAANKEEKEAHDTLLGTMSEEGFDSYDFKDLHVAIDKKQKCKVQIGGAAEKEADDAD
jgi:hypothetical protein